MQAQEFAETLGIPVERSGRGDIAVLATSADGHNTIRIPRQWGDINNLDTQRVIWHEIEHYLDRATHRGGHSQLTSRLQYGRFSTENREKLHAARNYLQSDRAPVEVEIQARYKGKVYNLAQIMANSEIPESVKDRFRIAIQMKERKWRRLADDYLEQYPEIFADGFAKYMMDKKSMLEERLDLAILFEYASRDPDPEVVPVKVKPVFRKKLEIRRRPVKVDSAIGGIR